MCLVASIQNGLVGLDICSYDDDVRHMSRVFRRMISLGTIGPHDRCPAEADRRDAAVEARGLAIGTAMMRAQWVARAIVRFGSLASSESTTVASKPTKPAIAITSSEPATGVRSGAGLNEEKVM